MPETDLKSGGGSIRTMTTSPSAAEPGALGAGRSLASALEGRPEPPAVDPKGRPCKITVRGLDFFYGAKRALEDITIDIPANLVTAFIGPSGCGKSTFLRTLNRMNDIIPGTRVQGQVLIDGIDIYGSDMDIVSLRRRVGMVFQKSNPFPKSIF